MRGAQENKYQMIPGTHENTLLNKLNRAHYFHDDSDINYYELYDLKADPHELHNIYGQKGTEKTFKKLHKLLDIYRSQLKVDEY